MEDVCAVGDTYDGVVTRLARLDPRDGCREGEPKRQGSRILAANGHSSLLARTEDLCSQSNSLRPQPALVTAPPWKKSPALPGALTARVTSPMPFSVDLELQAIVDPDLTFRARMDFSNHRAVGAASAAVLLGSAASRWRLPGRSSLLLSGGINDGVAKSHRRVAIATPRGPPTSPRAAPDARGFLHPALGRPFCLEAGE